MAGLIAAGQPATLEEATEILEEPTSFLGPQSIELTYGFKVPADQLPPLPPKEVIRAAYDRHHGLMLRIPRCAESRLITMERINAIRKGKNRKGDGRLLEQSGPLMHMSFFTEAAASALEWSFFSRAPIEHCFGENYVEQTGTLVEHAKEFWPELLSPTVQEAITEFKEQYHELRSFIYTDRSEGAKRAVALKVNQLFREPPVVLFDRIVRHEVISGEKLFPTRFMWTQELLPPRGIVLLGSFDGAGMALRQEIVTASCFRIGACFSLVWT